MAFKWRRDLNGGEEVFEEIPQAAVSVTVDTISYSASGYATNATGGTTVTTDRLLGVAGETQDNSSGSAGDVDLQVQVARGAIYEADTDGTPTQAQMGTNTALLASSVATVDEDNSFTGTNTRQGIFRMWKLINATNKKVEVVLNFFAPREDS